MSDYVNFIKLASVDSLVAVIIVVVSIAVVTELFNCKKHKMYNLIEMDSNEVFNQTIKLEEEEVKPKLVVQAVEKFIKLEEDEEKQKVVVPVVKKYVKKYIKLEDEDGLSALSSTPPPQHRHQPFTSPKPFSTLNASLCTPSPPLHISALNVAANPDHITNKCSHEGCVHIASSQCLRIDGCRQYGCAFHNKNACGCVETNQAFARTLHATFLELDHFEEQAYRASKPVSLPRSLRGNIDKWD